MADDRRRQISPDLLLAIQEAVTKAFEENAHRCLVGFTTEDRANLLGLKMLVDEYPPNKLRESFKLMSVLVKARNTTGNIIFGIVICGLSIWGLHKLFPDIWDK